MPAKKKRNFPTDENGERLPPEERWALIDGPWKQPELHSRWKDFNVFMAEYKQCVEESAGTYYFQVKRDGLNDTSIPDAERFEGRVCIPKVKHTFDEDWVAEHPECGGGLYSVYLMGPKVDKVTGKEHSGQNYLSRFYNLKIEGHPNQYIREASEKKKRPRRVDFDEFDDPVYDPATGAWDVAKQMTKSADAARAEQTELLRDLLGSAMEGKKGTSDHDATVELARVLADQKQHSTDSTTQMLMAMMKMQGDMAQAQMQQRPQVDNSKEMDSLMRMLDSQKSDARGALEEERNRSRQAQEQQRQSYLDQIASLKEDRDRRERELKDELDKLRGELREKENRLEGMRSELSTVKLEKVSAEVKATLGGQNPEAGGLAGFTKMLKSVRTINNELGLGGGGGDAETGDWKSKLAEFATDPRAAAALGNVAQGVVSAFQRPGMQMNPALPPPMQQVQQLPDPAQQAWAQQQAQLQAQRQAALPAAQPEPPAHEPAAQPEAAAEVEEKSFEDLIEEAAEGGIAPEDFMKPILEQFNLTLTEAKAQTQGQTIETVVKVLGLDLEKLTVTGQEYVKEIYHMLQRTDM